MIKNLISKITAILGVLLATFTIGRFFGKRSEENEQIKTNFEDAVKSKKRQQARKSDDISTIKRRMQKYVRK